MDVGVHRGSADSKAARAAALCVAVATLLYARQISMWAVPRNRFYYHWQRSDTWALFAGLLTLAALLFLVAALLRRAPWGGVLLRWGAVVLIIDILAGYAGSGKSEGRFALFTAGWAGATGLGLYAASRASPAAWERGTAILAALAWLAPISAVQMLLWKPWVVPTVLQPQAPRSVAANRPPVFLFLFDEWSYQRSYDGDELRPFFRNLRRLAGHSLEFTNAHTLAGATNPSIPRLLFQRPGELVTRNGVAVWKQGDSTVESARVPSIFAAAHARGYGTSLIGFYFPYRTLLGDQVDYVADSAYVPKGTGFWSRAATVAARNLEFLADPLSQVLYRRWYARTLSENWFRMNHVWRRALRDLIRRSDRSEFALIHWPVPHGPFILDADGSYRGPFEGERLDGTPDDYRRHLGFLDLVLGEALAELDSAGLLDPALVIVTSDHSWKAEPDRARRAVPESRTWVPLLVKLPHQTTGYRIPQRFCMGQLGALLERAMDGRLTEANGAREVPGLPSNAVCTIRSRPEPPD